VKIHLKNLPKLSLQKLLQRRKMSLQQFLEENNIKTYDELVKRCSSGKNCLDVVVPTQKEFEEAFSSLQAVIPTLNIVSIVTPKIEQLSMDVSIALPVELNVGHFHDTENARAPEVKEENDSKKHSKKKIKTDE
jgi:hypothetical protein